MWLLRAGAIVVIGVETFAHETHHPQAVPLQIAAFALICLAMAVWAAIEQLASDRSRLQRAVPFILGFICAVGGLAGTARGGGYLVIFAVIAILYTSDAPSLVTGLSAVAIGVLAIEIGAVIYGGSIGTQLGLPLALVSALAVGQSRRVYLAQAKQSAQMLAREHQLLEQQHQLLEQQQRADVLDERARIAREIHDVLAHSLGALGIQIQAARAVLTDYRDIDRALDVLATAQRMATDGLTETRRAVHALRSDTLPLDEEVAAAARRHAAQNDVEVSVAVGGQPRPLPPTETMALLRVAQEGLVNAAKHAPHQPVDVHLDDGKQEITLTLDNPVTGRRAEDPDEEPGEEPGEEADLGTVNGGYGLTGMRERLLLVNGTLSAGPRDGRWVVTATLPQPPRRGGGATGRAATAQAATARVAAAHRGTAE
jgi:signal transduction histidine kinase